MKTLVPLRQLSAPGQQAHLVVQAERGEQGAVAGLLGVLGWRVHPALRLWSQIRYSRMRPGPAGSVQPQLSRRISSVGTRCRGPEGSRG